MPPRCFILGTPVVFDPTTFNPSYWASLSEADKQHYYGPLGYGSAQPMVWIFLTEILGVEGHCILVRQSDGKIEVMRHTADFRRAREDEL